MNSILEAWQDPSARHAMLVHLPIALGSLGVIPALLVVFTRGKSHWPRWIAIFWFALAAGGAGFAAGAGEDAEHRLEETGPELTEPEYEALENHEGLGAGGWKWPLIPAALLVLTLIPKPAVRQTASVLALLAAIGVTVWIVLTAHAGGRLVYEFGLGVPARTADAEPAPSSDGQTERPATEQSDAAKSEDEPDQEASGPREQRERDDDDRADDHGASED